FPESGVFDSLRDQGHMTERELEGRAQKTFRQFRASFDWPRPAEDRAHIALCALASKPFIPASFVRAASRSRLLTRHPGLLTGLARFTDVIRLYSIGLEKLIKGELTWVKIREYGGFSFRRVLTQ
ncbi:hypothetical protein KDL45_16885, partial [bacterium]|nr:hypothetical protein [bacterium]